MKIYWMFPADNLPHLNDGDFYNFFLKENTPHLNDKVVNKFIQENSGANFVTLNPQFLNWLDDSFAKENVYVRVKSGFKKLGDVEKVQFKFDLLGPGEVVCDTDFSTLD
jgi:hypothetical protein